MRMRISHALCVKMAESEQGTSSSTSSRGNPVESATSSTCYTDSEGTDSALSLLQRLRSPLPSELARKRAIKTNPPVGAKRGKGRCSATPKTVSVGDRLKAYPEENFVSSNNRLFCSACREVVALKKKTLLKAGIPLAKADCLRELLEEDSTTLTSASNLSQLLPFILHEEMVEEMAKLKSEVQGQPIYIIFDGTTHVCEAMVIVLRFIDDQWRIQQRVGSLKLLAKSMSGEEVAQQIVSVISQELGIPSSFVIAASRDRASVNDVAMQSVKVVYSSILDIGCFSHTLDHVGERLRTQQLDTFKVWVSLFVHSPKTRLLWRTQTGLSPPLYSTTRWWSRYEVIKQMHDAFGDVCTFLFNQELPTTTTTKMTDILNSSANSRKLKIELAVTVDAMDPFVRATYKLEGDGPLSITAYECVCSLYAHISVRNFRNVNAVARQLAGGNNA